MRRQSFELQRRFEETGLGHGLGGPVRCLVLRYLDGRIRLTELELVDRRGSLPLRLQPTAPCRLHPHHIPCLIAAFQQTL